MSNTKTVECQDEHVTKVAAGSAIARLMDWRAAHGYDPRLLPGHFCEECKAAKRNASKPPKEKPLRRGKYAAPEPAEPPEPEAET